MKQFITEAERLQKLAGISEIKIIPSTLGGPKIPKGWEQYEVDPEPDMEEDIEVEAYSAPMEGWDEEHYDTVSIMKTPEDKYYVQTYISFGDIEDSEQYNSFEQAKMQAIRIMNDIKYTWRK
jgi:hypothetical protein